METNAGDFRGSSDTASVTVKVILAPPRVTLDDAQHYIDQGGMDLAVLTPRGSWSEAGVKVVQYIYGHMNRMDGKVGGRVTENQSLGAEVGCSGHHAHPQDCTLPGGYRTEGGRVENGDSSEIWAVI